MNLGILGACWKGSVLASGIRHKQDWSHRVIQENISLMCYVSNVTLCTLVCVSLCVSLEVSVCYHSRWGCEWSAIRVLLPTLILIKPDKELMAVHSSVFHVCLHEHTGVDVSPQTFLNLPWFDEWTPTNRQCVSRISVSESQFTSDSFWHTHHICIYINK